jgi:hypothetical protein
LYGREQENYKKINKYLESENLRKGKGYFYFFNIVKLLEISGLLLIVNFLGKFS